MQTQDLLVDLDRFQTLGQQLHEDYRLARPYAHAVIDHFLPPEILERVLEEFPDPEKIDWIRYDSPEENKLATRAEAQMGPLTRRLLQQLNSSVFLEFLETLTGIGGLIPDPHFWGGGLHQIQRGGFLKVHVDFNYYRRLNLQRRLNLLVYLNQDWREEYGGHLELWNGDMSACEKRILPVFNRCVVFSTTSTSYHGHPEPLTCPEGRTRRSLALYYYTSTVYEGDADEHGTLFRARPGEKIHSDAAVRRLVKRWLPPILVNVWRRVKGSDQKQEP